MGGEGYIGSAIVARLAYIYPLTNITSLDAGWFSHPDYPFMKKAAHNQRIEFYPESSIGIKVVHEGEVRKGIINFIRCTTINMKWEEFFKSKSYDVVIWVAGHSSVKMCQSNSSDFYENAVAAHPAYNNNYRDFTECVIPYLRMEGRQPLFIYASSASVYGNSDKRVTEQDVPSHTINLYDTLMRRREIFVRNMTENTDTSNTNIVGLRFGTVNGASPNFRSELMLNSMMYYGMKDRKIMISNPDTKRSILDIRHLSMTICDMIDRYDSGMNYGVNVFNLGSINSTVGSLAVGAKKALFNYHEIDAEIVEFVSPASPYSFHLDCSKISDTVKPSINFVNGLVSPDRAVDISYSAGNTLRKILFDTGSESIYCQSEIWLPNVDNRDEPKEYK